MSTNEPTITVNENTSLEDIVKQLDELGLLKTPDLKNYEFRLYYNEEGVIYASASTAEDAATYGLTGGYVVVTREEFDNQHNYRVTNGKLSEISRDASYVPQLEKSKSGFAVAKNNAGILLEDGEEHTDTEHYDYRNR